MLSGGWDAPVVTVEGYQPREGEDMNPYANSVSSNYFATMRMPIVAGREGTLSASPNGEFVVNPFGEGDASFHRRVLRIGDVVGLLERFVRLGHFLGMRVRRHSTLNVLSQMIEQFLAGWVRSSFPLGGFGDGFHCLFGSEGRGGGNTDELSVLGSDDSLDCFGGFEIDRDELRAEGGRTQDFAVPHPGTGDIGSIFVDAGYDLASVRPKDRSAEHLPIFEG